MSHVAMCTYLFENNHRVFNCDRDGRGSVLCIFVVFKNTCVLLGLVDSLPLVWKMYILTDKRNATNKQIKAALIKQLFREIMLKLINKNYSQYHVLKEIQTLCSGSFKPA